MKDLRKVVEDIAREILKQYGDDLTKVTFTMFDGSENCVPSSIVAGLLSDELALRSLGLQRVAEIIRRRVTEFPDSLDLDETVRLGEILCWYLCEEVEKRLDEMDEETIT